jgi:NADH-quinone oxidoreductase subunit L
VPHPRDAHAHGQAQRDDHEVAHGVADVAVAHGHGWHGPHESPRVMTVPLMALAVGAMVAGFVGIPQALGGRNTIEHFLEPSFTASASVGLPPEGGSHGAVVPPEGGSHTAAVPSEGGSHGAESAEAAGHVSRGAELGLMLLSVLIAAGGILVAVNFYVNNPDIPARLAARWPGTHALLFNKYYVDELYNATAIKGTLNGGRGLWAFDGKVVDGAVNGSGWLTQLASWASHMVDKYVVDGLVNLVGWTAGEGSFLFRRVQTGLVQNYALLMLLGVFAFLTVYLLAR